MRSPALLGACALMLASLFGCGASPTVPRMMDGEVVDGAFVSEADYANALLAREKEERRKKAGESKIDETRGDAVLQLVQRGDLSSARELAARALTRDGPKTRLTYVQAIEGKLLSGDLERAIAWSLLARMSVEELAARWYLLRGEQTPQELHAFARARGAPPLVTFGGDSLPSEPVSTAPSRLALSIYLARRTGERGVFVAADDCPRQEPDPTMARACERVGALPPSMK